MQLGNKDGAVIVAGRATKDGDLRRVGDKGTPMCMFGLAVGKRGEETVYANCKAWYELAEYAGGIRKGDSVCVAGRIEESEYKGKPYRNVVADWLNVARTDAPVQGQAGTPDFAGFTDVDDNDLPF